MPDGDMPDGDMPDGDMPDGDMPDGDMPDDGVDRACGGADYYAPDVDVRHADYVDFAERGRDQARREPRRPRATC